MSTDIASLQALASTAPAQKKASADPSGADPRTMEKAREFEAVFIAQMLKFSGMDKAISQDSGFGGDAFSSMMLEQYARKIVDNGGFGLADHIYAQLRDQQE